MKLPAMPIYIGDLLKDPGVQALNLEEFGFYMKLLFLMWESKERGYLIANGVPIPNRVLSYIFHVDEILVDRIMTKLLELDCLKVEKRMSVKQSSSESIIDGKKIKVKDKQLSSVISVIFNYRMVKDEAARKYAQKYGKRGGGNPNFQKGKRNPYYKLVRKDKGLDKSKITPSYSLSIEEKESLRDEKKNQGFEPANESVNDGFPVEMPRNGHRASRMSREVIQSLRENKALEDWCFLECPDLDFAEELEELHDYWVSVAGRAGLKLDWVATARNSLRKHQKWKDDRKTIIDRLGGGR